MADLPEWTPESHAESLKYLKPKDSEEWLPEDNSSEDLENPYQSKAIDSVVAPSLAESLLSGLKDAGIGGAIGLGQGLSDIGANVAQFPSDIYSYLTGKEGYKAPKPDFREYIPESASGQNAAAATEFLSPLLLPLAGGGAAGTNLLHRLLAGSIAGAAESENRPLGAALGALFGSARELPIRSGVGARHLNAVEKGLKERGMPNLKVSKEIFKDIKNNQFLRNTAANRRMLDRAKTGTYKDLFSLQSDLGRRERSFTRDPFSAANREFGRDIGNTRQDLLKDIRAGITKEGHLDLAELMKHGQNRYRQYMAFRPYRNALAVGALASSPLYTKLKKLLP